MFSFYDEYSGHLASVTVEIDPAVPDKVYISGVDEDDAWPGLYLTPDSAKRLAKAIADLTKEI